MKNNASTNVAVIASLFCLLAIASRFLLIEWPNFKPVAAVAIFLGFYCRDWRWAVASVAAIMLVSDWLLGFYSPALMAAVYTSMAVACWLGMVLKRYLDQSESSVRRIGGVAVSALAAAIVFYLVTNIAVVFVSPWYPDSGAGILQSLAAGLPFFKFTLAGNVLFSFGIFTTYFWVSSLGGAGVSSHSEFRVAK